METFQHSPTNAGLLALKELVGRQQSQPAPSLDDARVDTTADLLAATDGIAIAFRDNLGAKGETAVRERIEALLGPTWHLANDSIDVDGVRFSGQTALPPPGQAVPIGEAWALARKLAVVAGVRSAIPLFAQVA